MSELNQLKMLIESFSQLTRCIHSYERAINELSCFTGVGFPFKSPVLQLSYNEIRFARMFSGDCVRLLVNGANARTTKFDATPLRYTGAITQLESEKDAIIRLKGLLRKSLYKVLNLPNYELIELAGCDSGEFWMYHSQLLAHLKRCDQCLGLRLGEI